MTYDPDIRTADSDDALIAVLILPQTNIISEEHVGALRESLRILQRTDPSIHALVDIIKEEKTEHGDLFHEINGR